MAIVGTRYKTVPESISPNSGAFLLRAARHSGQADLNELHLRRSISSKRAIASATMELSIVA
jgi:hypothetical protein